MSDSQVRKGLNGVISDYTSISKVMPESNSLTYRGYAVEDLVENCSFEEVIYLLWFGELPTTEQLRTFNTTGRSYRSLDAGLISLIHSLPNTCHPMDVLRTAVSYMGTFDPDPFTRDADHIRSIDTTCLRSFPWWLPWISAGEVGKRSSHLTTTKVSLRISYPWCLAMMMVL